MRSADDIPFVCVHSIFETAEKKSNLLFWVFVDLASVPLRAVAADDDAAHTAGRAGKQGQIIVVVNQLVDLFAAEGFHRGNLVENHVADRVGKRHARADLNLTQAAKMRAHAVSRNHERIIQKRARIAAWRVRELWIAPLAVDR